MKTIKANKLREVLSSKGIDEGFIDRIFKRLSMAKNQSQLKQVEKDLERAKGEKAELMSNLEKLLIKKYGSYDKIPDLEKKFLAK